MIGFRGRSHWRWRWPGAVRCRSISAGRSRAPPDGRDGRAPPASFCSAPGCAAPLLGLHHRSRRLSDTALHQGIALVRDTKTILLQTFEQDEPLVRTQRASAIQRVNPVPDELASDLTRGTSVSVARSLAWIHASMRMLHAIIHIDFNRVPSRLGACVSSRVALAVMWVRFSVQVSCGPGFLVCTSPIQSPQKK